MRNRAVLIFLCGLVLYSCKRQESNRDKIIGTWHATKMENTELDSFFMNSQKYIDTFGKGHDDATNIRLYGVANVDSIRQLLQVQHDSAKSAQMSTVTNTSFMFRRDGVAMLSFGGALDSDKWSLDATGNLVLTDMDPNSPAASVTMEILSLTDSTMRLKMHENDATTTVTFMSDKK